MMLELNFPGQVGIDMGDVTDEASVARIWLGGAPFSIVRILATFSGDSGSATLTLKVDNNRGTAFDHVIYDWDSVGVGSNRVLFHVPRDEREFFTSFEGDPFVFERTSPSAQSWAISVVIDDASELRNR